MSVQVSRVRACAHVRVVGSFGFARFRINGIRMSEGLLYRIQVSTWWPKLRDLRVVRLANTIWTSPKRIFYDQHSDERDEISEKARNYLGYKKTTSKF